MTDCPDTDRLVTLERAADWELSGLLEHLTTCSECRAELRDLETLRVELTAETEPRSGFTDEVLRSVTGERPALAPAEPTAEKPRRPDRPGRYPSLLELLNIGMAGLTATFAIAVAAGGSPTAITAAPVLAGGLVAAAFYALAGAFAGSR